MHQAKNGIKLVDVDVFSKCFSHVSVHLILNTMGFDRCTTMLHASYIKRFQVAKQGLLHTLTVAVSSPFITANSGNLVRLGVCNYLIINDCVATLKHPSRSLVSGKRT